MKRHNKSLRKRRQTRRLQKSRRQTRRLQKSRRQTRRLQKSRRGSRNKSRNRRLGGSMKAVMEGAPFDPRNTTDINKSFIVNLDKIAKTPAPRWVPDNEKNNCMICERPFKSVLRRKHHCRKCGRLVCGDCSRKRTFPNEIRLEKVLASEKDEDSVPKKNTRYRICSLCYDDELDARAKEFRLELALEDQRKENMRKAFSSQPSDQ